MLRPYTRSIGRSLKCRQRASTRWILSAASLAILAGAGCDQMKENSVRQADRRVGESLSQSETKAFAASQKEAKEQIAAASRSPVASADGKDDALVADMNQSNQRTSETLAALTAAANEAGASPEVKATAKGKLARVEFAMAMHLSPAVEHKQQQMGQILWELRQAASQIKSMQATNAAYALANPNEGATKSPKAALDERAAAVSAAFDKADTDAKAIRADLDQRKAAIEALKQEKTKADADAESLAEKSAAAKGKEALDLFNQSNELRQKGGELGVKIDVATLSLLPVERSLAIAEQQKLAWKNDAADAKGALQRLDAERKDLDAAWEDRQAAMGNVTIEVKKIGDKMAARTADLMKTAADAKTIRDNVAAKLTAAAKHFGEAADACKALSAELGPKVRDPLFAKVPQLDAWKSTLRLYDEGYYRLQQGAAQVALAELQAQYQQELQNRKKTGDEVATLTKDAGLAPPADLFSDASNKDLETVKADVSKSFDNAEKTLDAAAVLNGMAGGESESTKNAAHVMAIEARVGHLAATDDADVKTRIGASLTTDKEWAEKSKVQLPAGIEGKF